MRVRKSASPERRFLSSGSVLKCSGPGVMTSLISAGTILLE